MISLFNIRELFHLVVEQGLTSIPSITKRHIQCRENKQRVKLAILVLSTPVYTGLMHAKKKKVSTFEIVESTVKFCLQFYGIFDLLNYRLLFPEKLKKYKFLVDPNNVD